MTIAARSAKRGGARPRIAINISNCVAGGGLQIGTWFMDKLMRRSQSLPFQLSYILNSRHLDELEPSMRQVPEKDVLVVGASPMRSLKARRKIGKFLEAADYDCVLSLFGPSGISHPRQISGVANAFITSPNREVMKAIFGRSWPIQYLRYLTYGRMLSASSRLIFETAGERDNYAARWHYPIAQTHIIGNSVNDVFSSADPDMTHTLSSRDGPRILFVTGTQPHKNNHMIPGYVAALKRAGLDEFSFALTLDREAAAWHPELGPHASHVEFLGVLSPDALLREYQRSHVVVQPSSFETYSAVYNETRFIPRTLLASDRPFARGLCSDFALFFEPLDTEAFARTLLSAMTNLEKSARAAWDARKDVLLPEEKFQMILDVIEESI
ncbi:hypothetical protein [Devosia sp. Root635]|uniref:hypothetical protein n=1 Tax=Devosia sp. Root635 TaxID=1736575 RepID=UPI00070045D7|nr:hypothetical protein [Devosia sp. Root635]KRA55350.1 hypothetical protein ASD80_13140 [Devosia sp. Root635]